MLNTDPRWQAYFADLEKETNGEILREDLAYGMLQLYRSHNYNVSKQGAIDSAFFEDFDPDPAPGIPRRKCPVPSDDGYQQQR